MTDTTIQSTRATVSTAALLTLTTGIVMVEGMAGVYEAAEAVTGHAVWTHEMGYAIDRAKALVPAQIPDFPTAASAANFEQVRAETLARFGETIEIERGTDQRNADPLATLADKLAELGR